MQSEPPADDVWSSMIDAVRVADQPAELRTALAAAQAMVERASPTRSQRDALLAVVGKTKPLKDAGCRRLLVELDDALRKPRTPSG